MSEHALVKYDAAVRALAECVRVDDVKSIHDKAMAMQVYAQQAKDSALIDQATEIRLRAEIRAGELLAEMKVNGTRAKPADTLQPANRKNNRASGKEVQVAPTLADLGITHKQSHQWQQLAALPRAEQEAVITAAKSKAGKAVNRAPGKSGKAKQAVVEEEEISRAAVNCILAMHDVATKAIEKLRLDDLAGLESALRQEFAALRVIIKRRRRDGK